MSSELTIGVAIPAYKNRDNLRRCLNSIAATSPALLERTVVVDDSGDGSVALVLKADFPQVVWIIHERNLGFGGSATEAVSAVPADAVVLLNDDVTLLGDPSASLHALFADPHIFAVTFQSRHADGTFREGAKRLAWPMGFPRILHNPRDQVPSRSGVQESAYAVGGHAAYNKEKFLALGGFDPLFEPFYWEDVDLCERARTRSWRTLYCSDCIVLHDEGGAIRSSFDRAHIREITLRNRLLFSWRHLPAMLRPLHSLSLGYQLARSAFSQDRVFLRAFKAARERWRQFRISSQSPLQASNTEGVHLGKD